LAFTDVPADVKEDRFVILCASISLLSATQVGFSVTAIYEALIGLKRLAKAETGSQQDSDKAYTEMQTDTSVSGSTLPTPREHCFGGKKLAPGTLQMSTNSAGALGHGLIEQMPADEDSGDLESSTGTQQFHPSDPDEAILSTIEHEDPQPADNPPPPQPTAQPFVQPPFVLRQTRSRLLLNPKPIVLDLTPAMNITDPIAKKEEPLSTARREQLFELWEAIEEELEGPTTASSVSDFEATREDLGYTTGTGTGTGGEDGINSRASSALSDGNWENSTTNMTPRTNKSSDPPILATGDEVKRSTNGSSTAHSGGGM